MKAIKTKVVKKGEALQPDVPDELLAAAKHVHYIVRGGVCEEAIVEVETELDESELKKYGEILESKSRRP